MRVKTLLKMLYYFGTLLQISVHFAEHYVVLKRVREGCEKVYKKNGKITFSEFCLIMQGAYHLHGEEKKSKVRKDIEEYKKMVGYDNPEDAVDTTPEDLAKIFHLLFQSFGFQLTQEHLDRLREMIDPKALKQSYQRAFAYMIRLLHEKKVELLNPGSSGSGSSPKGE